jgi:hypothetical protein
MIFLMDVAVKFIVVKSAFGLGTCMCDLRQLPETGNLAECAPYIRTQPGNLSERAPNIRIHPRHTPRHSTITILVDSPSYYNSFYLRILRS